MPTPFIRIDRLSEPLSRMDALMTMLLSYTTNPMDDVDTGHVTSTLLMAMEQLDEIKAGHESLLTAYRAGAATQQVAGGKIAAVKVA